MSAVGEKLINEIRRVAQRYPEKTDETSRYVIDGQPQCLVGHALLRLDGEPGFISRLEENGSLAFDRLVDSRTVPELDGIRDDETMWINRVQKAQDLAKTWVNAVNDADEWCARRARKPHSTNHSTNRCMLRGEEIRGVAATATVTCSTWWRHPFRLCCASVPAYSPMTRHSRLLTTSRTGPALPKA